MSSLIDFHGLLNTAFKEYDPETGTYGHALIKIGETENGVYRPFLANTSPQAGQILAITKNRQRYTQDTTVSVDYIDAEVDEVVERTHIDINYTVTKYKAGGIETTEFTVPAGAPDGKAFLLDVNSVGIASVDYDDPFQDFEFYILGDIGIRILYGFHTDRWREILTETIFNYFVHPPLCIRCSGTGIDSLNSGVVCPDCDGYGYVGNYASGNVLTIRGNDVDVKRLGSDDTEYAMRAWSAKHFVFPSVKNIKSHLAFMLNVDEEEITITEVQDKEIYYEVEYPVSSGSRIDPYGVGVPEILERIRTVSIPVVPIPYIISYSSGALIAWFPAYIGDEHPTLGSGHTKLTNDSLDIPVPSFEPSSFWGGSFVGGSFETRFIPYANYSQIDSGSFDIISGSFYYVSGGAVVSKGDPIFSGSTQLYNGDPELSGFFSGISSDDEYEEKIILDSFWYEVI